MRIATLALALIILPACAPQRARFTHARALKGPIGPPAARYAMFAPGVYWGEVRVWTHGFEAPGTDVRPARPDRWIHIGFAIQNETPRIFTLDLRHTQLHLLRARGQTLAFVKPAHTTPTVEAVAGRETQIAVFFPLPERVLASEVAAYRVVWSFESLDGNYTQATSFFRDRAGRDPALPPEETRTLVPNFLPYGWRPGFGFEDVVGY